MAVPQKHGGQSTPFARACVRIRLVKHAVRMMQTLLLMTTMMMTMTIRRYHRNHQD
jgi:hypothetical protein